MSSKVKDKYFKSNKTAYCMTLSLMLYNNFAVFVGWMVDNSFTMLFGTVWYVFILAFTSFFKVQNIFVAKTAQPIVDWESTIVVVNSWPLRAP